MSIAKRDLQRARSVKAPGELTWIVGVVGEMLYLADSNKDLEMIRLSTNPGGAMRFTSEKRARVIASILNSKHEGEFNAYHARSELAEYMRAKRAQIRAEAGR